MNVKNVVDIYIRYIDTDTSPNNENYCEVSYFRIVTRTVKIGHWGKMIQRDWGKMIQSEKI